MRRQQLSAEGGNRYGLGNSKSTSGLNKGQHGMFSRNSQMQSDSYNPFDQASKSGAAAKQGNPIFIRTLPFLKRKLTEEFNPDGTKGFDQRNYASAQGVNSAIISPLVDNNTNQRMNPMMMTTGSIRGGGGGGQAASEQLTKSQIRFFVHNVGGINSKFLQSPRQYDEVKGNSMHNTAKSSAAFGGGGGCRSNTPLTQLGQSQSPLFTPHATFSAYNSTRTDFNRAKANNSNWQQLQVQQSNQIDPEQSNELLQATKTTQLPPVYDRFSDTQKHFFENFVQETRPVFRNDVEVLDDKTISDEFEFRFKSDIASLENQASSLAFINGFPHNFPFIMSIYKEALREQKEAQDMKDELKRDMAEMVRKAEQEIEEITNATKARGEVITTEIREDFVKHSAASFASSKEITKLLRDKLNLQAEIEAAMEKIVHLESRLYGQEIFNLEAADPCFNSLTTQNLRGDTQVPNASKAQEFIIRNIIH